MPIISQFFKLLTLTQSRYYRALNPFVIKSLLYTFLTPDAEENLVQTLDWEDIAHITKTQCQNIMQPYQNLSVGAKIMATKLFNLECLSHIIALQSAKQQQQSYSHLYEFLQYIEKCQSTQPARPRDITQKTCLKQKQRLIKHMADFRQIKQNIKEFTKNDNPPKLTYEQITQTVQELQSLLYPKERKNTQNQIMYRLYHALNLHFPTQYNYAATNKEYIILSMIYDIPYKKEQQQTTIEIEQHPWFTIYKIFHQYIYQEDSTPIQEKKQTMLAILNDIIPNNKPSMIDFIKSIQNLRNNYSKIPEYRFQLFADFYENDNKIAINNNFASYLTHHIAKIYQSHPKNQTAPIKNFNDVLQIIEKIRCENTKLIKKTDHSKEPLFFLIEESVMSCLNLYEKHYNCDSLKLLDTISSTIKSANITRPLQLLHELSPKLKKLSAQLPQKTETSTHYESTESSLYASKEYITNCTTAGYQSALSVIIEQPSPIQNTTYTYDASTTQSHQRILITEHIIAIFTLSLISISKIQTNTSEDRTENTTTNIEQDEMLIYRIIESLLTMPDIKPERAMETFKYFITLQTQALNHCLDNNIQINNYIKSTTNWQKNVNLTKEQYKLLIQALIPEQAPSTSMAFSSTTTEPNNTTQPNSSTYSLFAPPYITNQPETSQQTAPATGPEYSAIERTATEQAIENETVSFFTSLGEQYKTTQPNSSTYSLFAPPYITNQPETSQQTAPATGPEYSAIERTATEQATYNEIISFFTSLGEQYKTNQPETSQQTTPATAPEYPTIERTATEQAIGGEASSFLVLPSELYKTAQSNSSTNSLFAPPYITNQPETSQQTPLATAPEYPAIEYTTTEKAPSGEASSFLVLPSELYKTAQPNSSTYSLFAPPHTTNQPETSQQTAPATAPEYSTIERTATEQAPSGEASSFLVALSKKHNTTQPNSSTYSLFAPPYITNQPETSQQTAPATAPEYSAIERTATEQAIENEIISFLASLNDLAQPETSQQTTPPTFKKIENAGHFEQKITNKRPNTELDTPEAKKAKNRAKHFT